MRPILTFILLATVVSCTNKNSTCSGKQVECPAFSNAVYDQWFPYKKGQQLIFATPTGDKDTIRIADARTSASYQTTVSGGSPNCFSSATVVSDYSPANNSYKLNIQFSQNSDQYVSAASQTTYLIVKGANFSRAGITDTGLASVNYITNPAIYSRFSTSAVINNVSFNNIQEIYKDTTKALLNLSPYKIWIAKNVGLVGYEEYHGKFWIKQ